MNEKEIRIAVNKALGWSSSLSDEQWNLVLDWEAGKGMSFSAKDIYKYVQKAKELFTEIEEREQERDIKIKPPAAHIRRSEEVAADFESKAERLRLYLGLKKPLSPKRVKAFLKKFKPAKGDNVILIKFGGLDDCVDAVSIQGPNIPATNKENKLLILKREIDEIIKQTGWLEYQTTDFILCGRIPILPYLTVTQLYVSGPTLRQPSINITAHNLNIPAGEVREVYIKSRDKMLSDYSGQAKRRYKPRPPGKKVLAVIDFFESPEHENLSPEEKWRLWKKTTGKAYTPYKNWRSMLSAYINAKKRPKKG